jgi:RNA polymerase sigma-70 factor (ECF subfamily)
MNVRSSGMSGGSVVPDLHHEPSSLDDADQIRDVYESLVGELSGFARARLRDPTAADDIVQEAFLRLAIESNGLRYPREPRAWLYRVVLNLIVSRARRGTVARRHIDRQRPDEETHNSPESIWLASERCRDLGQAMAIVPPDGRMGLIMAAEGYSGREIAVVLGRSEAATRTLLCRTRREVRRELTSQQILSIAG